jgi:hypothetical protein
MRLETEIDELKTESVSPLSELKEVLAKQTEEFEQLK